jgi:hypothetical protein
MLELLASSVLKGVFEQRARRCFALEQWASLGIRVLEQ